MDKLSKYKVNKIVNDFIDSNSDILEINKWQIEETKKMYNSLMNEEVNISKTLKEQESLITDILIGFAKGEDRNYLFRSHSDNKHLNFFDTFLGEGETGKILETLEKAKLPTSILRGVRAKQDIDLKFNIDGKNVEIQGWISPSPDGEQEQNDFFRIKVNGKLIYVWSRELDDDFNINDIFLEDDDIIPIENQKTKSGKERKGTYLGKIITSKGDVITKELLSNGAIVHRSSNGRFTKKV